MLIPRPHRHSQINTQVVIWRKKICILRDKLRSKCPACRSAKYVGMMSHDWSVCFYWYWIIVWSSWLIYMFFFLIIGMNFIYYNFTYFSQFGKIAVAVSLSFSDCNWGYAETEPDHDTWLACFFWCLDFHGFCENVFMKYKLKLILQE